MKNVQWITSLLNTGRRLPFLKMLGRRRNNNGMIWTALIGLGVSTAAYGFGRNQKNGNMLQPFQNLMNNVRGQNRFQNIVPNVNNTALAEMSNELTPNNDMNKNK